MSKFKSEIVWEIMKKYDFGRANEIGSDFLCILCKKLLINARISLCECRFCFDCISNYLNEEKKPCPGNTEDCKIELLCLNENIAVDNAINNKILKLIVTCPEESCEFKCELRNIEDHIRICNYRPMSCSYLNIGCNSFNMHAGNVIDNLQLEIGNQTKLLIDCIDNLNNEIGKLKISVDKLGEENNMLKCEINEMKLDTESKQMEIDKLNKKLLEIESKFEIDIKPHIDKEFDKLKLDGDGHKKSIEALENKFEQQNAQNEQIENEFVNATKERENKEKDLMKNIDQMKNKQTEMTTMSNKIDQTLKNVEKELLKMEVNLNKMRNGEFVWRIDKINDKMTDAKNEINTRIRSDSFFTHKHGYKMCLLLYPDGFGVGKGTHLSVYFCIMKGEFDDILQWPFKYDVTFLLINQQTGLAHVSETKKYDAPKSTNWNKPIHEINGGLGFHKLIELEELSTNANLILKNQIFIKCSVKIYLETSFS